jgi:hypothetical protein
MKNIKGYQEFLLTEKLSDNEAIDLYVEFIRILKIHENVLYKEIKISIDIEFKGELDKVFDKIKKEKAKTEELYSLVHRYEEKIHGEAVITPKDNFGCSMWDVCDIIAEGSAVSEISEYIEDFSDEDVYIETEPWKSPDFDKPVIDLDELSTNLKEADIIMGKAYEEIFDKKDDRIETSRKFMDNLIRYKKKYPKYADNFQIIIDYIKNNFLDAGEEI